MNFMRAILAVVSLNGATLFANGDGATCTTKDFRGVYAFVASGTNLTNNTPITFVGSITADGVGKITAWKDWVAVPADPPVPPNFKYVPPIRDIHAGAKSIGNDIHYSVEPDCRITIRTAAPGPTGAVTEIVQLGALAAGGAEVLLINGSPTAPYVTVVTMKRARVAGVGQEK